MVERWRNGKMEYWNLKDWNREDWNFGKMEIKRLEWWKKERNNGKKRLEWWKDGNEKNGIEKIGILERWKNEIWIQLWCLRGR